MYLDARILGPKKTAKKMSKAIRNRNLYYDFFRFHRYYRFHAAHDNPITNPICVFCAALNDKLRRDERKVYVYFTHWWNEIPPGETPQEILVYYNISKDSHVRPKLHIENPNKYATNEEDDKKDGLLSKLFNHLLDM